MAASEEGGVCQTMVLWSKCLRGLKLQTKELVVIYVVIVSACLSGVCQARSGEKRTEFGPVFDVEKVCVSSHSVNDKETSALSIVVEFGLSNIMVGDWERGTLSRVSCF